jgi:hypothetical protein
LAVDNNDNPVITWEQLKINGGGFYHVYTKRWNGDSWEPISSDPNALFFEANGSYEVNARPSLAIDSSNNPVISFSSYPLEDGTPNLAHIYVYHWTGSNWEKVGGGIISEESGYGDSVIALDSADNPYVVWSTPGNIYLKRFTEQVVDTSPPTTTITLSPPNPDGSNGWYKNPVTVIVTPTDDSSGVADTRCRLSPAQPRVPNTFDDFFIDFIDPYPCPYLGTGAPVGGIASDAAHTLYVASRDNADNKETPVKSLSFKVDTTPPSVGPGYPDRGFDAETWYNHPLAIVFNGQDATSGIERNNAVDFSLAPCATITYSGPDSVNINSFIVLSGTCTDVAGNSRTVAAIGFRYDATPPLVTVVRVTPNGTYPTAPDVFCQSSDALSGIVTSPVLTTTDNGNGSFTATCTGTDRAGNTGTASVTYTVTPSDTTPPDTTITGKPNSPINITAATFSFVGSDNVTPASSLTFECALDNSAFASCTAPKTYLNGTLSSGNHTFQVSAVDSAGNKDPSPATYSWLVDTTSPTATSIMKSPSPFNAQGWNSTDVTATWNWADAGGAGINNANCPATTVSSGEGSSLLITANCFDLAGNKGIASVTVKIDKSQPDVAIYEAVKGKPVLTLTLYKTSYRKNSIPPAICNSSDPQSGLATAATPLATVRNNSLQAVNNPPKTEGTYTATCTATNNAGLSKTTTVSFTVTAK